MQHLNIVTKITRHKHSLTFRVRRYNVIATKPIYRMQICPIGHNYREPPTIPQVTFGSMQSCECGKNRQTYRETDTQTDAHDQYIFCIIHYLRLTRNVITRKITQSLINYRMEYTGGFRTSDKNKYCTIIINEKLPYRNNFRQISQMVGTLKLAMTNSWLPALAYGGHMLSLQHVKVPTHYKLKEGSF